MTSHTRHSGTRPQRAFTLVEITVSLVILAILAAIVIPRFTRTERRQFGRVVEQVSDLLIVYAQRDRLSRMPVGLYYDSEEQWLTVVLLDDPDAPGTDEFGWRRDPTISPVKMPEEVNEIAAYENGEFIDIATWPLTNRNDQTRPKIELEIDTDRHYAVLTLEPHAVAPRVRYGDSNIRQPPSPRDPIDLDRGGRNREQW